MSFKRKKTKQRPTGDDDLDSGHLCFCVDELIHPLSRKRGQRGALENTCMNGISKVQGVEGEKER